MHGRLHLLVVDLTAQLAPRKLVIVCALLLLVAPVGAQTASHQHPVMPSQPQPAGSTPASGSGAQTSDGTPKTEGGHAGMAIPANDHANMAMPVGDMPMGHEMKMEFGPLPDTQEASGTAWQPAATPMHAHHSMIGDWQMMTHYNVFLSSDHQSGPRGGDQFNSVNWLMLMATRRTGDNELAFRGMFSAEPWTTTGRGYPLLFQSGEAYRGEPLIDRQHPHDFFMELSGRYRRLLTNETVLTFYVAPSGEPALGPPAFPHRQSAMDNPAAPISHHWLDSTHIAFGVLTVGIARKTWQVEGSWFRGREPDDDRWDIERPELDSYSGRFTWNPSAEWSAQISHGYLKEPEELHPGENVRRTTVSVMNHAKLSDGRHLATTMAWGRNGGQTATGAFLVESNLMLDKYTIFARAEYVEKTGEELGLLPDDRIIAIKQLTLGASRELVTRRPYQLALGASLTYSFKPGDLDALYGRNPFGLWVFLRLRPAAMEH